MFKIGLCSVTFRNLSVEEVIEAAKDAQIQGIEWGGDIHVPPGNLENAEIVASLTEAAGLEVTSYGSYYRLGEEHPETSFESILETAVKLKAPSIRVWAGKKGSDEASREDWLKVKEDAKRIADLAKVKGVRVNLEYHRKTLTDTAESTIRLLEGINHSNVSSYWQPAWFDTEVARLDSIERIKPWLTHVHVFHWKLVDGKKIVYPFSEGINEWRSYVEKLRTEEKVRYLMMELVKNDTVEQFKEDVEVLRSLIK